MTTHSPNFRHCRNFFPSRPNPGKIESRKFVLKTSAINLHFVTLLPSLARDYSVFVAAFYIFSSSRETVYWERANIGGRRGVLLACFGAFSPFFHDNSCFLHSFTNKADLFDSNIHTKAHARINIIASGKLHLLKYPPITRLRKELHNTVSYILYGIRSMCVRVCVQYPLFCSAVPDPRRGLLELWDSVGAVNWNDSCFAISVDCRRRRRRRGNWLTWVLDKAKRITPACSTV